MNFLKKQLTQIFISAKFSRAQKIRAQGKFAFKCSQRVMNSFVRESTWTHTNSRPNQLVVCNKRFNQVLVKFLLCGTFMNLQKQKTLKNSNDVFCYKTQKFSLSFAYILHSKSQDSERNGLHACSTHNIRQRLCNPITLSMSY